MGPKARGHLQGVFDNADHYDRFASRLLGRLYRRIASDVAASGLTGDGRVLDVGTGPGRVPLAIVEAVPGLHVDGIDLSPSMIEHAREAAAAADLRDRVTFVVADVADLPYSADTFDMAVSSMSQHHWTDVRASVSELCRVVRPGGRIWIYDLRFLLSRAVTAARATNAAKSVRVERIRTGRLPISLVSRLTIECG